jgi:hypothetical protein
LALLLLGALACNTLTGGLTERDAQATADAFEEQSESISEQAEATAAAVEATADAAQDALDDNDNANDNDNSNESGDNANENDNDNSGADDDPFDGQGPDDIPVFTGADDPELVLADDASLTYTVSGTDVEEVADFYREAMPDAGWELVEGGDLNLGLATTLQYQQDGRMATITMTALLGDQVTVVAVVQ